MRSQKHGKVSLHLRDTIYSDTTGNDERVCVITACFPNINLGKPAIITSHHGDIFVAMITSS